MNQTELPCPTNPVSKQPKWRARRQIRNERPYAPTMIKSQKKKHHAYHLIKCAAKANLDNISTTNQK